ncbi:MAG: DeoR/GlpR transcriptional regulator [Clostridia bacterium]|nr:DeoR/GlpR transcriptional regulator [Clostridia bacterium]
MKPDKRKDKILEILKKNGTVRVTNLSKTLNVSEVTVRNYLTDMESKGLLARVHGGAIFSYRPYYSMNLNQRLETNRQIKERIAKKAANLVKPNDTVMLNAGTTTLLAFRYLPYDYNLNIVTNSISIALEGSGNPNYNIVLIGGTINSKFQFTYGEDAIEILKKYHADKLILSVDGVDMKNGFSTYYAEETQVDKAMIEQSDSCIIVADNSKFDKNAFSKVYDLNVADYIVTDKEFNTKDAKIMSKLGIKIIEV